MPNRESPSLSFNKSVISQIVHFAKCHLAYKSKKLKWLQLVVRMKLVRSEYGKLIEQMNARDHKKDDNEVDLENWSLMM